MCVVHACVLGSWFWSADSYCRLGFVGGGGRGGVLSWAGLDHAQLQSLCVHERKSEKREGGREGGGECASVNAEQQ